MRIYYKDRIAKLSCKANQNKMVFKLSIKIEKV